MPKREVSDLVDAPFWQSVKYENSSVDLISDGLVSLAHIGFPRRGIAPEEDQEREREWERKRNFCRRQGYHTDVLRQIGP